MVGEEDILGELHDLVLTCNPVSPIWNTAVAGFGLSSRLSSRSSTSSSKNDCLHFGEPFIEMVKTTVYKNMPGLRFRATYEVYLNRSQLHWFLLVKLKSSELPFIRLEITTETMTELIPTLDVYDADSEVDDVEKSVSAGEVLTTLMNICETADKVVQTMCHYSLLSNNCQHFCNNLLKLMNLQTYPTTVGQETTLERRKRGTVGTFVHNVFSNPFMHPISASAGAIMNVAFGAPNIRNVRPES